MIEKIKQIFCKHIWCTMIYSYKCYDEEIWYECIECKKQLELGEMYND